MKRTLFFLLNKILLFFLITVPNFVLSGTEIPQWINLFNGKDLTGWVDVNTSPETWYVKDGMLITRGAVGASLWRTDAREEGSGILMTWYA